MLRQAEPSDYAELGQVMFDAVHGGQSPYSAAQQQAWVPFPRSGPDWDTRLAAQHVVLSQGAQEIEGFMSLGLKGYIDLAFIRHAYRGQGVFGKLFNAIQSHAKNTDCPGLWVHASLAARPAFAAHGFEVIMEETVRMGSESLDRFEMKKRL